MSEMQMIEGYLLKHRTEQEILPTTEEKEMENATGGLVLEPFTGMAAWTSVLDLKSLYPSSMATMNISRETLTWDSDEADIIIPDMPLNQSEVPGEHITEDDIGWDLDDGAIGVSLEKQGILPKYISQLFPERSQLKNKRSQYDKGTTEYIVYDNQQNSVKVIMNSSFGVSDNDYFRLATEGLGDAITAASRYVAWKGMEVARDMGYEVIYSDTDSQFIQLAGEDEDVTPEEVVQRGNELEEAINAQMDEVADDVGIPDEHPFLSQMDLHGTDRQCYVWENEKLYRRYLQAGSKKRYAGNMVWKEGQFIDDTDISGFEAKRSSVPPLAADYQTDFIEAALEGMSFEEFSQTTQDYVERLKSGSVPIEQYGDPGVLNKPPEEYPNRPVKRATIYSNKHLGYEWREDDNPWLVFVKDTPAGLPRTDVIAVDWRTEELPEGFTIDYANHIEKHLKGPNEPFLEMKNWEFSELKTGKQTQSVVSGSSGSENPFASSGESSQDTEDDEEKNPNPFA